MKVVLCPGCNATLAGHRFNEGDFCPRCAAAEPLAAAAPVAAPAVSPASLPAATLAATLAPAANIGCPVCASLAPDYVCPRCSSLPSLAELAVNPWSGTKEPPAPAALPQQAPAPAALPQQPPAPAALPQHFAIGTPAGAAADITPAPTPHQY